jgi:hypothetical protein
MENQYNDVIDIFKNSSTTISSLLTALEKIKQKYGDQYLTFSRSTTNNVKIVFDGYTSSSDCLEPQFKVVIEYVDLDLRR